MRAPEAIEAIQTLQGIEFPRTFEVVIYKGNKEKCPHFQISMSYPLVFLNMLHSSPLFSQHYTCSDDHIYELFQRMGSIVLTDYQCQEWVRQTCGLPYPSHWQCNNSCNKEINYQVLFYLWRYDQANGSFCLLLYFKGLLKRFLGVVNKNMDSEARLLLLISILLLANQLANSGCQGFCLSVCFGIWCSGYCVG